jgi:hypothetical protein
MESIKARLEAQNWEEIGMQLREQGFVIVKQVLSPQECQELITGYGAAGMYRKTIRMERYRFGLGEYKYFRYPLPELITSIRETVYPKIVPVANAWMQVLNTDTRFPAEHEALLKRCKEHQQVHPTVLILQYGEGGFNTLHQDLYGDVFFPMQLVIMLDQAGKDYTGGEFVITEQIPRAQSKANVLQPDRGDMLLFTTNFRPVKGSRGYYRVNMKHGVSPLKSGKRHSLGIIFHDATS